jgi:hypothetical protein
MPGRLTPPVPWGCGAPVFLGVERNPWRTGLSPVSGRVTLGAALCRAGPCGDDDSAVGSASATCRWSSIAEARSVWCSRVGGTRHASNGLGLVASAPVARRQPEAAPALSTQRWSGVAVPNTISVKLPLPGLVRLSKITSHVDCRGRAPWLRQGNIPGGAELRTVQGQGHFRDARRRRSVTSPTRPFRRTPQPLKVGQDWLIRRASVQWSVCSTASTLAH